MEIHLYDIFMLIVLGAATIFGAWKGMAWQVASIASLIVSYFVALQGSGHLAPYLGTEEPWNRFLAMFIIYLACSAAIWLAFQFVSKFIERVKLQEFDRQIGAIIGFAKGGIICLAITFFTVTLSTSARDSIMHTRSGYVAAVAMDRAHVIMPDELHAMLEPYIHQLDDAVSGDHLQHAHDDHDHGDEFDKLGSKLREEAENWFERSVDEVKKATEPAKTGKTNDDDPLDRLFRR